MLVSESAGPAFSVFPGSKSGFGMGIQIRFRLDRKKMPKLTRIDKVFGEKLKFQVYCYDKLHYFWQIFVIFAKYFLRTFRMSSKKLNSRKTK
jgi:hypothetical protein